MRDTITTAAAQVSRVGVITTAHVHINMIILPATVCGTLCTAAVTVVYIQRTHTCTHLIDLVERLGNRPYQIWTILRHCIAHAIGAKTV